VQQISPKRGAVANRLIDKFAARLLPDLTSDNILLQKPNTATTAA
jgi:hypothetical protein